MPTRPAMRTSVLRMAAVVTVSLLGLAGITWAGDRAAGSSTSATVLLAAGEGTIVVAHRGDAVMAPENTLPAIAAAVAADADVIELDVQLSADGIPVIMHDWTVDRTTDGTGPTWTLSAAELAVLDASAAIENADTLHHVGVPTLAQALEALAATRSVVMLELKGAWNRQQVTLAAELIREATLTGRAVFASFDFFTLLAAKTAAPSIPRLLLTRHLASIEIAIADTAATAIGVSTTTLALDPDAVARLTKAGIGVFLYTLNEPERWTEALAVGVRGIITDDPGVLRTWLATAESPAAAPTNVSAFDDR